VLIPQVLPQVLGLGSGGQARTGLLLSALPLGFGVAALFGDAMLPKRWADGRRGSAGALLTCAVMGASIFVPMTGTTVVLQLALAGLGLGLFVPANDTAIMRSAADSSASLLGGLVDMARGIGTMLGICSMALALHLGSQLNAGHGYAGSTQARPAFIVLALASAAAAALTLASRAQARGQAGRTEEADPSGAHG
jgi:MFS family permease